jgi:hypothetical protein
LESKNKKIDSKGTVTVATTKINEDIGTIFLVRIITLKLL